MKYLIALLILIVAIVPTSAFLQSDDWYFNHNASADIPGYEQLYRYPTGTPQSDESVTVSSAATSVLIDLYSSPIGSPGAIQIRSGLWRFRTFHYVDNTAGITTVNFSVFIRNISGGETYYFSAITDDINTITAPDEYLTSYAYPYNITLLTSDRLIIKVYGRTDSVSNKAVHFVYGGSTNTSHVFAPGTVYSNEPLSDIDTMPPPEDFGVGMVIFGFVGGIIGGMIIVSRYKKEKLI